MRFEVAPLPLDVVVCFFLWTGIVPSLWEFVWNVSRNGICLYYYLVYPSLGRLYFTHNSGWHLKHFTSAFQRIQILGVVPFLGITGSPKEARRVPFSVSSGSLPALLKTKDSSNNVIYDSQPGASDTADPTTTDATGNIR